MSGDQYPCRGAAYATQQEAAVAMEAALEPAARLMETPYLYVCIEGHFHFRLIDAGVSS